MRNKLPNKVAKKIIADYFHNDRLCNDCKLPTQKELQAKYFVSRTTIVKALEILREDNLIYSIQGKGVYFANDRHLLYLNGVYSYDYELLKDGILLDNHLLSCQVCKANEMIAKKLAIKCGDDVIEIIRKKVDRDTNIDIILQCNYLRYDRFSNLDFNKLNNNRLYAVLGIDCDLHITNADEQIMISRIERTYSKFLAGSYNEVMRIDRTSYEHSQIIEYTQTYLLQNSFKYYVQLNITNKIY